MRKKYFEESVKEAIDFASNLYGRVDYKLFHDAIKGILVGRGIYIPIHFNDYPMNNGLTFISEYNEEGYISRILYTRCIWE